MINAPAGQIGFVKTFFSVCARCARYGPKATTADDARRKALNEGWKKRFSIGLCCPTCAVLKKAARVGEGRT